jgi:hypothetical protein
MDMNLLYGALPVIAGMLASAIADRIRGLRIERRASARALIEHAAANRSKRDQVVDPITGDQVRMADQVIGALVTAGWKRNIAKEATWRCGAGERITLESWCHAAFKNAGLLKTAGAA